MSAKPKPKLLSELAASAVALDKATERRGALTVEARVEGYGWDVIARELGMTANGAERLAIRANGGVRPTPRQRAV